MTGAAARRWHFSTCAECALVSHCKLLLGIQRSQRCLILDGDSHYETETAHVCTMQILTEGFTLGAHKYSSHRHVSAVHTAGTEAATTQLKLMAGKDANGSKRQQHGWQTHKATKLLHKIMKQVTARELSSEHAGLQSPNSLALPVYSGFCPVICLEMQVYGSRMFTYLVQYVHH